MGGAMVGRQSWEGGKGGELELGWWCVFLFIAQAHTAVCTRPRRRVCCPGSRRMLHIARASREESVAGISWTIVCGWQAVFALRYISMPSMPSHVSEAKAAEGWRRGVWQYIGTEAQRYIHRYVCGSPALFLPSERAWLLGKNRAWSEQEKPQATDVLSFLQLRFFL